MEMYKVTIKETLKKEIPILATSPESALKIIKDMYYHNEIVINDINADSIAVDFEVIKNEKNK